MSESKEKVRTLPKIFRLMKCRWPTTKEINPSLVECAGIWELNGWEEMDHENPIMILHAFHKSCPTKTLKTRYYPGKWITFKKIDWTEDKEYAPEP